MPDYKVTVRRSTAGWTIVVLMIIIGVVAAGFGTPAQAPPGSAGTTATLKVVPTMRYVTVSPAKTTFDRCRYGQAPFHSKPTALGYPHSHCWVGEPNAKWPITIKNGPRADILVQASNAVPSDGGNQWRLCKIGGDSAVACDGHHGLPGKDQFVVTDFSSTGRHRTELTGTYVCDTEFNSSGGCLALTGQSQREGLELIGPSTPDDNSTSWKVTITWIAVAPGHH